MALAVSPSSGRNGVGCRWSVRHPRRNAAGEPVRHRWRAPLSAHLLSTLIFGTKLQPNKALQAPVGRNLVFAFRLDVSVGSWAGYAVAVAAIISGFGAINGWTMVCAEISQVAAGDHVAGPALPASLRRNPGVRDRSVDVPGIALGRGELHRTGGRGGVRQWVVLLAGLSAAVPYGWCAGIGQGVPAPPGRLVRIARYLDLVVGAVAFIFALLIVYGAFTAPPPAMTSW